MNEIAILHLLRGPSSMLIAFGLLLLPLCLAGQVDTESPEKKKARIQLEYISQTGEQASLKATVKTKIDDAYETVSGVDVYFTLAGGETTTELGKVATNEKGEASLVLDKGLLSSGDDMYTHQFIASLRDQAAFLDAEKELLVMESAFDMEMAEEDSLKILRISLSGVDSTGKLAPVEGANIKFFVKRMFGQLPVGDGYESTDGDGVLEFGFPADIPGDSLGRLTIIAQLEDDNYGTLVATKTAEWGVPVISRPPDLRNKLWSARANAPVYLIVLVNAVIVGIWGTIVYILMLLLRIRKLGNSPQG